MRVSELILKMKVKTSGKPVRLYSDDVKRASRLYSNDTVHVALRKLKEEREG